MRSTSLGVAEAGNLSLIFMAKKCNGIVIFFAWLEYIFKCYADTNTAKTLLAVGSWQYA